MANNWYMLTLIGEDRPGIVAAVTRALFDRGMNLGEASMLRLGGNFTIMLMVRGAADSQTVEGAIRSVAVEMGLRAHVDAMTGGLHRHLVPNIQVTVSGADRAGIVAQVTGALAAAGLNILELESDVAGSEDKPLYVMQIAGLAEVPVEQLAQAVAGLRAEGVDVRVEPIETLVG
jgi:glycine cleavage system transcriptional repressor